MAKFCGNVGYVETVKNAPGSRWTTSTTLRRYYGDVTRNVRKLETGTSVNDDVAINNEISIIADPYAQTHFFAIRFVEWQGVRWKVTNVEVLYPRLVLSLGGLYHGDD